MSHSIFVDESCLAMCAVVTAAVWVMTHMYSWVMAYICDESWHIYKSGTAHVWKRHDSLCWLQLLLLSVSWQICHWVMAHICNESWHIYAMSHGTYINETRHAQHTCPKVFVCTVSHLNMSKGHFSYVPCLIYTCAVTHLHMCRDSFVYVPWLAMLAAVADPMWVTAHMSLSHGTYFRV